LVLISPKRSNKIKIGRAASSVTAYINIYMCVCVYVYVNIPAGERTQIVESLEWPGVSRNVNLL
jgi:hypothetical protein